MEKLTDKEIIKALECCIDCKCKECPCYKNIDDEMRCTEIDEEEILDLINRQKAEIKSLIEKLEAVGDPLQDAHYKIAEQQAEIEKLSNCVVMQENLIQEQVLAGERIAKMIIANGKIKAEAIKSLRRG